MINRNLITNSRTHIKSFSGATSTALQSYVDPTLNELSHDIAVVHCGTNDISPPRQDSSRPAPSDTEIANNIITVGTKCKNNGIPKVIISSIIPRISPEIDKRRVNINKILVKLCTDHDFQFLDNSTIQKSLLWSDGLHLSDEGTRAFTNNLIYILNGTLSI